MHMQGEPRTMQANPHYDDVSAEVYSFVLNQAAKANKAGVGEIWVDPGLGFGKTVAHNLALVHHLGALVAQAHERGLSGHDRGEPQALFGRAGGYW